MTLRATRKKNLFRSEMTITLRTSPFLVFLSPFSQFAIFVRPSKEFDLTAPREPEPANQKPAGYFYRHTGQTQIPKIGLSHSRTFSQIKFLLSVIYAKLRIKSEKADALAIERDRSRWLRRQLFRTLSSALRIWWILRSITFDGTQS